MASLASGQSKSSKKIYFYDDSNGNRPKSQYNNDIEFIKIPTGGTHDTVANDPRFKTYGPAVKSAWQRNLNGFDKFYINSGFQGELITQLDTAIDEERVSILVFDWDRTLSLIDGCVLGSKPNSSLSDLLKLWEHVNLIPKNQWTTNDLARYMLQNPNTPERIDNLARVLNKAQERGIPVYVLTNNASPLLFPGIIVEILAEIGVNIPLENIVGGGSQYAVRGPHEKSGYNVYKFTPTGKPKRRGSKDITIMEYIKPHAEKSISVSNNSGNNENKSNKPALSVSNTDKSSIARLGNKEECEDEECRIMGGRRKKKSRRRRRVSKKNKSRRRRRPKRGGKRKSRKTKKFRKKKRMSIKKR